MLENCTEKAFGGTGTTGELNMNDDKLIDFAAERDKRIHDLRDKRLDDMRQAFEQAMPLAKKKKPKNKPKKR